MILKLMVERGADLQKTFIIIAPISITDRSRPSLEELLLERVHSNERYLMYNVITTASIAPEASRALLEFICVYIQEQLVYGSTPMSPRAKRIVTTAKI